VLVPFRLADLLMIRLLGLCLPRTASTALTSRVTRPAVPEMITDHVPAVGVLLITRLAVGLRLCWREETWKTAEMLILRHQLAVLQRRQPMPAEYCAHATWEYSRIRPPSRSRRKSRILAPAAAGSTRPAGGFWCWDPGQTRSLTLGSAFGPVSTTDLLLTAARVLPGEPEAGRRARAGPADPWPPAREPPRTRHRHRHGQGAGRPGHRGVLRRPGPGPDADPPRPQGREGPRYFPNWLRQRVEAIIWTLKSQLGLERHGGRVPAGLLARVVQRLLALNAATWHNWQASAPVKRSLIAYDH
jgi:hypothetical protein